jgi:hypothetical protein
MKILAAAKKNKQTVTAVGASRQVCAQCEAEIKKVNGPFKIHKPRDPEYAPGEL